MDMKNDNSAMQCVNCPGATDHSTADCPWSRIKQASDYLDDFTDKAMTAIREGKVDKFLGIAVVDAQPQPSAAQQQARPSFSNANQLLNEQPSAAQSAPAGEREAFEAKYPAAKKLEFRGGVYLNRLGSELPRSVRDGINDAWVDFQAGAAWQRAQSAPVEPKPTGLSRGWNLVRQCDGFVIGHSSDEPKENHKQQALADGRVYVPFMVEQSAPAGAVPEGWRELLTDLLLGGLDGVRVCGGQTQTMRDRISAMLAAAPQPVARQEHGDELKTVQSDLVFLAEYVLGREYGRALPNYEALGRYPIDVAEAALSASAEGKA